MVKCKIITNLLDSRDIDEIHNQEVEGWVDKINEDGGNVFDLKTITFKMMDAYDDVECLYIRTEILYRENHTTRKVLIEK